MNITELSYFMEFLFTPRRMLLTYFAVVPTSHVHLRKEKGREGVDIRTLNSPLSMRYHLMQSRRATGC